MKHLISNWWVIEWIDWLIGLNDWLNDWLDLWLVRWAIDWLNEWLVRWPIDWINELLIKWVIDLMSDWLNEWLIWILISDLFDELLMSDWLTFDGATVPTRFFECYVGILVDWRFISLIDLFNKFIDLSINQWWQGPAITFS